MPTEKTRTIGEAITAAAIEYIELYKRLRQDDELHDRAGPLATHDLIMRHYIAGEALKRLEVYIAATEATA